MGYFSTDLRTFDVELLIKSPYSAKMIYSQNAHTTYETLENIVSF